VRFARQSRYIVVCRSRGKRGHRTQDTEYAEKFHRSIQRRRSDAR
jgi:hypothetical protein